MNLFDTYRTVHPTTADVTFFSSADGTSIKIDHTVEQNSVVCWAFSRVQLCVTPWTVAHQAPLSMGFSRQEYWSGLPFPSPGDLPNPGMEPRLPAL